METTELQREIIDICIDELQNWKNSSNLSSPTHNDDAEIALYRLDFEDKLGSIYCDEINDILQELRSTIIRLTK